MRCGAHIRPRLEGASKIQWASGEHARQEESSILTMHRGTCIGCNRQVNKDLTQRNLSVCMAALSKLCILLGDELVRKHGFPAYDYHE